MTVRLTSEVFERIVEELSSSRDLDGNLLRMDSIIVSQGELSFTHSFQSESSLNDIRSISKPILAMALGKALSRGLYLRGRKVSLETPVWPFFEDKIRLSTDVNERRIGDIQIRHLLNHTMGFDVGLMFSKDVRERDPSTLLEYIWNTELVHDPGSHFVYSNVGPFIISALIQEELGVSLDQWVNDLLFKELDVQEFQWRKYGKYCAGCSGLVISNVDLHKVGRVLVDDGLYLGRYVVPRRWVEKMRSVQVLTPSMFDERRVFPKYGYGYYLWICKGGSYYCDGTDGQYLIVLPDSKIVITTFGHQPDMKPITECLRVLVGRSGP